ncbi:MAG: ComEC/Rec2 family competence protein [Chitinophagales bacterium]
MSPWNAVPLFRMVLPFVCGIVLVRVVEMPLIFAGISFLFLLLLYFLLQRIPRWAGSYKLRPLHGVFLQMLFFTCGMFVMTMLFPQNRTDYFMDRSDEATIFICRVRAVPEETDKNFRLYAEVEYAIRDSMQYAVSGHTILYIRKDSATKYPFAYGDILYVKNVFVQPPAPRNPGLFDYAKYLRTENIYHIAYCKQDDYYASAERKTSFIWEHVFALRATCAAHLRRVISDDDLYGIAAALVLGERSDLADETRTEFAHAGIMHILAVSGLHVGILYGILEMLFLPWMRLSQYAKDRGKRMRIFKTFVVLSVIWLYACITGLTPSVSRSAVMFSFLSLGTLLNRHAHAFNILCASMLVLLIGDPTLIANVGFQLSYLAVAGILFLQPPLAALWKPGNGLLKYFWSLITVSVAAQIATGPLSIYYFHSFPVYFLLSNLYAIPLAFCCLIIGIIACLFGGVTFLMPLLSAIASFLFYILRTATAWINTIPGNTIRDLYIPIFMVCVLYGTVLFLSIAILRKKRRFIIATLALICSGCIFSACASNKQKAQHAIQFYDLHDRTAMAFISGSDAVILSDSFGLADMQLIRDNIMPSILASGIKNPLYINYLDSSLDYTIPGLYIRYPWISFDGTLIYICDKRSVRRLPEASNAHYIYLTGSPWLRVDSTARRDAVWIIGNENAWKSNNYWMRSMGASGISHHSMKNDGFWEICPTKAGF